MRKLRKKTMAGILVTALCMQTWAYDSGVGKVQAEGETWGDELVTEDGLKYEYGENGDIIITGYQGEETSLTIPAVIEGKPVTTISNYAFYLNTDLISVSLPNSMLRIKSGAFCNCFNLNTVSTYETDIELVADIREIDEKAFSWCQSLESITLPDTMKHIGPNVFEDCVSLKEIELPDTMVDLGYETFIGCTNLEKITIPYSVKEIVDNTFSGCDKLTIYTWSDAYAAEYAENHGIALSTQEVVNVTEVIMSQTEIRLEVGETYALSATVLPENATFQNVWWDTGYPAVATVNKYGVVCGVAPGETEIMAGSRDTYGVYGSCKVIVTEGTAEKTTEDGWQYQLGENGDIIITEYVGNATELTVPDTIEGKPVTCIESLGEMGYKITSIKLPDTVTQIMHEAFNGCFNLEKVIIPRSVTEIGTDLFKECEKVTIYTWQDSYALEYANDEGIPVVLLTQGTAIITPETPSAAVTITAVPTITGAVPTPTAAAPAPTVPEVKATPTAKATITPTPAKVSVPKVKKVTGLKVSAKKKALVVSWKKLSNISGYQIQVSTKSSFKGAKLIAVSKSKTKYTASKLKSKKKYYFRIRGYKTYKAANGKNAKAYGSWKTISKKTK